MEWYLAAILILGSLLILMLSGLPIAFAFVVVNVIGMFLWFGGEVGLRQLIISFTTGLTTFTLMPVPLFILMGEVMFRSGLAPNMIDALDKWLGRLPGRLGLLAVGAGTLFSTFTGASMASVAMLGSTLVPEMEKRGYKKSMSLGPILGSGGLAIMIPPSSLAVLLGAVAEISIGKLLVAIIIPGLLMATLYATYIVLRCRLQPSIAPAYTVTLPSMSEKLSAAVRYILPLGFIVFLVVGFIFLGIATPSEAAAAGALGTFILAAFYKRLNWRLVKESFSGTMSITVMIFMIIVGAISFSQILAFSGASSGLVKLATGVQLSPILIIIVMEVAVLIMGMFMAATAVIMVALPLFMPVVYALGFDPIWFGVVTLINIEMATTSPPFGAALFVMKGVAPPDTTMGDCYRAALPFLNCDLIAMAVVIAFPAVALWLPGVMR